MTVLRAGRLLHILVAKGLIGVTIIAASGGNLESLGVYYGMPSLQYIASG